MRLICLVAFCLLAPVAVWADLKSCQRLYTNSPGSLAGLRLSETKDLEAIHKGVGYMVRYQGRGSNRISLTFYDNGRKRVSRDTATKELIAGGELILALAKTQGRTKGPAHYTDENLAVPGAVAASIIHVGRSARKLGNEYLMIGIIGNCMYKLRYTASGSNKNADKKFDKLLRELALHFDPNA